jgi:hypothetical protein
MGTRYLLRNDADHGGRYQHGVRYQGVGIPEADLPMFLPVPDPPDLKGWVAPDPNKPVDHQRKPPKPHRRDQK